VFDSRNVTFEDVDVGGTQVRVYAWVDLLPPDITLDPVAVGRAVAAVHLVAVEERAIAREAVIEQRPLLTDRLNEGVDARHLLIPGQRHVRLLPAADGDARSIGGKHQDPLLARAIAPI